MQLRACSMIVALAVTGALAGAGRALGEGGAASPTAAVVAGPGLALQLPSGKRLEVAEPETADETVTSTVPRDFAAWYSDWDPWPSSAFGPKPTGILNYITLTPRHDETSTPILGPLYRAVAAESVVVMSADKSKTFERGKDYVLDEKWALVANLSGRLGKPGTDQVIVNSKVTRQRLDLLQRDAGGTFTLKKGVSALVCPQLPAADAGNTAVAGVYVAPWKRDGKHAVTAEDIYPIEPVEPVKPINPAGLAKARAALAAGREVKIAFLGDSITLGAEAGKWFENMWTEKNLSYASRVVTTLRKDFPKATVTPVAAFRGGITAAKAAEFFDKSVLPAKADVVVIAFGCNDAFGSVTKAPNNPPEKFKKDIQAIITRAQAAGMEVLLITPMQPTPFQSNGIAKRIPAYREVLIELSRESNVGCADVYTAWMNQARQGVPPFSQLHNCNNHPGPEGHGLYARTVLDLFK